MSASLLLNISSCIIAQQKPGVSPAQTMLSNRVNANIRANKYLEAINLAEQYIKSNPKDKLFILTQLDNIFSALNSRGTKSSSLFYQLGKLYAKLEENRKAVACLKVAKENGNHISDVYVALADAYLKLGDATAAIRELKEGQGLFPDAAVFPYKLAVIYDQLTDYQTATKYILEVYQKPNNSENKIYYEQARELNRIIINKLGALIEMQDVLKEQ